MLYFSLDQCALAFAVDVVVVQLDLRIAADAEEARALDHHAREQPFGVCGDHLVEADEHASRRLYADADPDPLLELTRHLHAHEDGFGADGILKPKRPGRREVGHVRKRMGRVESERREHGGDLGVEERSDLGLLVTREVIPVEEINPVTGERGSQHVPITTRFTLQHRQDHLPLDHQLFAPFLRDKAAVAGHRPDESDPLHEELVEVRGEDREELDALE